MIRDTRPKSATIAGFSRATHAGRMRNRQQGSRGSGPLLRVILTLCCITMVCCITMDPKDTMLRGIGHLKKIVTGSPVGYCDLDKKCDWFWNNTLSFKKVNAQSAHSRFSPTTDASNSKEGHFLWFSGTKYDQLHLWTDWIPPVGPRCLLDVWLYQVGLRDGYIRLIAIGNGNMSWIAAEKPGNNHATWEKMRFNVGQISQRYRLLLEMLLPPNSSIAVDNIRMVNCFPESTPIGAACTKDMFRCNSGFCLNKTRICDLTKDCADGEDEAADCDKIPKNARCNFEDGWCGWTNVPGKPLNWSLNSGPTPSDRTGPSYDHTYRNRTGTYAYVDMSKHTEYGSRGTIESPLYNPTPPYSSDPESPYHKSCQIRFFYHKYGAHAAALGLFLVEVRPYGNHTASLWWSYGDKSDVWNNEVVALPDIRYRYFLQFEASRGFSSKSDVAIDDISLSPECFAIGVPPEVVGDFNYYNPDIEFERVPAQHPDFANETVIRITTCGATGRAGPTAEQCAEENNGTDIELFTPKQEDTPFLNISGVQRWTASRGEYYTLIGVGARGGKGSSGVGNALGALVRAVIELQKGDQLYFMIGQAGMDACPRNVGSTIDDCQLGQSSDKSDVSLESSSKIIRVKNIEFKDGGGGGGGASAIFTLKANGEQVPILIAGGGGGLGLGRFTDNGLQHGRGPVPIGRLPSVLSQLLKNKDSKESGDLGGSGGSWNNSWTNNSDQRDVAGIQIANGGLGGIGCESGNKSYGNGGFGGGGGGCSTGGGGGGYIGGVPGRKESGTGEGGYSYASHKLTDIHFKEAIHHGPGEVLIIPAISGCGCDYRCVALDQHLSETKCLCPQGWILSNDSKSCIMVDDARGVHQTYVIPLIIVSFGLFVIAGICLIFYKRYQNQKALLHRRQVMFGNGTELTALRAVSDTMMTEFNPNYEFAGNLYSFKDLPQIPRDYISLVKPLGQGAFGEVFQGVYKYRREEHPVAVKTLPSLSTTQAEADFMMEALIMSKFNHPNIVHFIGVSFDKHPRYIILELLAGGDLKNFLREERPRSDRSTLLSMLDLVLCAHDIANGCKYMEEARFIHRDIAARNCLLTSKGPGRVVKIADFGMARDIYRSDYYRKGGKAMLPIKWMPPESFLDGVFTTKTDVWAYGVLLWEIMSFGYMPYTGCANREVMSMVTSGGRLEKPAGCPDPIYRIMTKCWHPRPNDRPSFSTLAERIGQCSQDPDVINQPTPNFDVLPACDREITIMRPDPEAECINVQSDLDGCGYMQPRIIDPRSVARHVGQAIGGIVYHPENEKFNRYKEPRRKNLARSVNRRQGTFHCKTHDCNPGTFEPGHIYTSDNNDRNDDHDNKMAENCKVRIWKDLQSYRPGRHRIDRLNRQDRKIHRYNNIEDPDDDLGNVDNGNDRPEEECHPAVNMDNAITDRKNGNESTTTTDTNSDSLIAQSSDTPPDTTTNSSPNTRTCSPSHTSTNTNLNNMNGIVKKNALKATLSLDPSALCRGTVPYEKITTRTQRSSTPGSMELRKDSLNHELPREEECSC